MNSKFAQSAMLFSTGSLLGLVLVISACSSEDPAALRAIEQRKMEFTRAEYLRQVLRGDRETVTLFLQGGMPVDAVYDRRGGGGPPKRTTALMLAAGNGHLELVRLLVGRGAKINRGNEDSAGRGFGKKTPLHFAARGGHLEVARFLVSQGAEVNRVTEPESSTSLMFAAAGGHTAMVQFLVQQGATLEIHRGMIYSCAAEAEQDGMTALQLAVLHEHAATVRALVQAGSDINAQRADGQTGLMIAMQKRNLAMTALLIELGADREARDNDGRTALMLAANTGDFLVAVVDQLLRAGVTVDARDGKWDWTALMFAAASGQLKMTDTLLRNGANPTYLDRDGRTALMLAADHRHPAVVARLRQSGATR